MASSKEQEEEETMKVQEFGTENRETIVLLHGGGLSWWNYRKEAELLQAEYHVVLPILDGHADSDRPFTSIEDNAAEIIEYIDRHCQGHVLLIGGLSLGALVLVEILSRRADICQYAVVESASLISSKLTHALIGPTFGSSYGLVRKKWFAKLQFRSLRMREDLFDDYYADTSKISKEDMIAFLKANTAYELKPEIRNTQAKVRIAVGGKEQKKMLRSAEILHERLTGSRLEKMDGLYHGEYSINQPEQYVKDILETVREERKARL